MKIGKIKDVLEIVKSLPEEINSELFLRGKITFSRNLYGHIFPETADDTKLTKVLDTFIKIFQEENKFNNFLFFSLESLTKNELATLVTLHFVPPTTNTKNSSSKALLLSPDGKLGILINEESHLTLFTYFFQEEFEEKLAESKELIDYLGSKLNFAKARENFYFTANPYKAGEALTVSILVNMENFLDKIRFQEFVKKVKERGFNFEAVATFPSFIFLSFHLTPNENFESVKLKYENLLNFVGTEKQKWETFLQKEENGLVLYDRFSKAEAILEKCLLLNWQEGISILTTFYSFKKISTSKIYKYFYFTLPMFFSKKSQVENSKNRAEFLRKELKD
ncbi:MAG: hypothetical protein DWQ06_06870 [Calditrichaeota bacterium]|nr:MAG: hypothetical protein DWQ06_06870 [Calditrichota bacterium]